MKDAERIEYAHRRFGRPIRTTQEEHDNSKIDGPTPMDIGNIGNKKLTDAERALYRKEGKCFRCGEKGHMVAECPKVRGN